MKSIQLVVEDLPELETEVAIAGSAKAEDVASWGCGIVILIVLIASA
jgi:hypothetical protein